MPKKRFSAEQTRATRGTISLQHPHSWHSRAGGGAVHSIISGLMHRSKYPSFDHLVGGGEK
jgi:hypothetical protein